MTQRFVRPGSLPILLLALAVLGYALYGILFPAPVPPDPTWTRIQQERLLRIGIDPSFPPFSADDGKGNLSGFDIALAQVIAKKWNVRIQYVYTGFDGLYDALIGNQFDLILSALPYNPQKTQDVYFTHSYFNGGPVLVVPGDNQATKSIYDLDRRRVAVELGTGGDFFARRWQRRLSLDLAEFDTTNQAIDAAAKGTAAGAIVDPISFYDFQRANPGSSLQIVGRTLSSELYVIAVRRDSPTLLIELNDIIDQMTRDGSLQELQKKLF